MNTTQRQMQEIKKILAKRPEGLELSDVDRILDKTAPKGWKPNRR